MFLLPRHPIRNEIQIMEIRHMSEIEYMTEKSKIKLVQASSNIIHEY